MAPPERMRLTFLAEHACRMVCTELVRQRLIIVLLSFSICIWLRTKQIDLQKSKLTYCFENDF